MANNAKPPRSHDMPFPDVVAHVWEWFWALMGTRTMHQYGVNAISYQEIDAWARLHGIEIMPWEVHLIRRLDDAVRSVGIKTLPNVADDPKIKNVVSINDVSGLKSILRFASKGLKKETPDERLPGDNQRIAGGGGRGGPAADQQ